MPRRITDWFSKCVACPPGGGGGGRPLVMQGRGLHGGPVWVYILNGQPGAGRSLSITSGPGSF